MVQGRIRSKLRRRHLLLEAANDQRSFEAALVLASEDLYVGETMKEHTLHFIGGGNMASAMIAGLDALEDSPTIVVCDPSESVRARHGSNGHKTLTGLAELRNAQILILAFKPQHFAAAVPDLQAALAPDALVVSIMAGISCQRIESALPNARVVRVMPNTPMAVNEGMSGVAGGSRATDSDVDIAAGICEPSGKVLRVDEDRMDAIAAVSGSGPAYFFRFCEVLVEAAKTTGGFSDAEARLLVSQTAKGAIAYLDSQDGFPAARLRQEVTSKGGTTFAALQVFDEGGLARLAQEAMSAAIARAKELDSDSQ